MEEVGYIEIKVQIIYEIVNLELINFKEVSPEHFYLKW